MKIASTLLPSRSAAYPSFSASLSALLASLAALCLAPDAAAAKPSKKQCAAAYEEAQAQRSDGKLSAAREQALVCAQDACPAVVRGDCARWLQEIEQSLPTLVFRVEDRGGQETADVRLYVDGKLARERLDGKAVPVDPGEHRLRFEIAGADPKEERVVVREGEKLRTIDVSFAAEKQAEPAATPAAAATTPDEADKGGGAPVIAYVLGGVGVLGLGAAGTFGFLALSEKGDLEERCAPDCSRTQVDEVRTKLLVADVALGVGVVSLGIATVLFLTAGPSGDSKEARRAPPLQVGVAPLAGGAFAGVSGAF